MIRNFAQPGWISKESFLYKVFVLMIGTAMAQAIPIAISPILTRLYSPSDFAIFSVFLSVLNTLAIVVTGRYELAIVLPRTTHAAKSLLKVSLVVSMLVSALFFLVFLSFGGTISRWLGNPDMRTWLVLLPLPLLFMGINQSFSYWLTREQRFSQISKAKFVQAASSAVLTLFLGFFPFIHGGLVLGNIVGIVASVVFTGAVMYASLSDGLWTKTRARASAYASRYSDFPKFNAVSTLIDSLGIYIPLWYISSAFSAEQTGYYGLSTRIIAIPLMLISTSLTQVYFKKASDLFNENGDIYGFTMRLFRNFFMVSIVPLILIILVAPNVFAVVFGSRWMEAGRMTQYVAIGIYAQVLINPFTVSFVITGHLKALMTWQVAYCLGNVLIVVLNKLCFHDRLYSFLTLYSAMHLLLYGIYMLMIVVLLRPKKGLAALNMNG